MKAEEWKLEIEKGLEYRRAFGLEESWSTLEALFYQVHDSSVSSGPNLIQSVGDSLVSEMTVPYPYVTVKPRNVGIVEKARIVESKDNELMTDMEVQNEFQKSLLHSYLWGTGILKLGYDSEFGWDESHNTPLGLSLTQFDKKGNRIEYDETIRPGMPWVKAVLPHDIVVPWGTTSVKDAPWIAHRVVRHIDAIKADPKYSGTGRLQPEMSREDFVRSYITTGVQTHRLGEPWREHDGTRDVEFCELWEIHDRHTGKVIVISTGHDKKLREDDDALQVTGLPFVDFRMVPSARSFWVTSDAYYLKSQQAELTDIALQATNQRRLSTIKFLYDRDVIGPEELEKALSSEVGAGIPVEAGSPLRDAIMPLTTPNQNMLLHQDEEYVRKNAKEAVGFSRNQMGEFNSGRRTAYEVSKVSEGHDTRMSRRLREVRVAYENIIRKTNKIIFEFWKSPRWTQVGDEHIPFSGPMLKDSYAYEIRLSTSTAKSLEGRKQEAIALYQTLRPDPLVDGRKLLEFIKNAFNDPEFAEMFRQDANIPIPMQGMQQGAGGIQEGGGQGQTPGV